MEWQAATAVLTPAAIYDYNNRPGRVRAFCVGSGMTGIEARVEMNERQRRLRYRAWHRGTREMDLVLGRFVDATLAAMSETEIDQLEALMQAPDPDLLSWVLGQAEVPPQYDTDVFRRLAEFNRAGRGPVSQ
jgi:antitoxin CptB